MVKTAARVEVWLAARTEGQLEAKPSGWAETLAWERFEAEQQAQPVARHEVSSVEWLGQPVAAQVEPRPYQRPALQPEAQFEALPEASD